jgi:hypothetical protein
MHACVKGRKTQEESNKESTRKAKSKTIHQNTGTNPRHSKEISNRFLAMIIRNQST